MSRLFFCVSLGILALSIAWAAPHGRKPVHDC